MAKAVVTQENYHEKQSSDSSGDRYAALAYPDTHTAIQ